MRIFVMFDLPVETAADRKAYTKFRKFLLHTGFIMMQESIYTKIASNSTMADAIADNVKENRPPSGLVQLLRVTEKQYSKMEFIVGDDNNEVLSNDERLVIL